MKKNRVRMWGGLGLWVAAVGMVCAAEPVKSPGASKPTLSVTVTMPQTASLAQKISANGSLAAWQEAVIGAEANGLKITDVHVNVGDRVQRGDVLATLQADTFRAELAQAEAALAEATASAQLAVILSSGASDDGAKRASDQDQDLHRKLVRLDSPNLLVA